MPADAIPPPVIRKPGAIQNLSINQKPALTSDSHSPTYGPLPIVFGITGHRNPRPEDEERLSNAVEEALTDFRRRYPSTPFAVMTPLAEGCDWIGARVALRLGARLIVPLPMTRDLFEGDLQTDEARKSFDELLSQADEWFEIPHAEGVTYEQLSVPGPERDQQYEAVGVYIIRNSQILIAMWDGKTNGLTGGTSAVVRYRLEGLPSHLAPDWSPLDPIDNGPVYHIVTPRLGAPPPANPLSTRFLYPPRYEAPEEGEKAMRAILERIQLFNRDALETKSLLAGTRLQSVSYLLPEETLPLLTSPQKRLLEAYSYADTMASHFQRKSTWTLRSLFIMVFIAVVFFEVYAHVFHHDTWIIGLYLGALGVAYLWSMIARRGDYQSKHLDYRAIAEGLRVQIYWKLAGIEQRAIDYYMRRQRSVMDWIREAMRSWSPDHATNEEDRISLEERLGLVSTWWVDNQLSYFRRTLKRDEFELERKERYVDFFFLAGLIVATVQMIFDWGHGMILAMGLLPVVAAMIHGYIEKKALAELVKQYERMGMIFVNAATYLRQLLDQKKSTEAQDLIHEVGVESLTENGDWVLLHRERPVDVPKAG